MSERIIRIIENYRSAEFGITRSESIRNIDDKDASQRLLDEERAILKTDLERLLGPDRVAALQRALAPQSILNEKCKIASVI